MKLLLALVMATSVTFAGKIVPNIKWNKIEQNGTGAAAALTKRNNVSLNYSNDEFRAEFGSIEAKSKTTGVALVGNINASDISAEISVENEKVDSEENNNDERRTIGLNVGKKITSKLALGITGEHFQEELGQAFYNLGFNGNYFIGQNFIIGAGITNNHNNGSDLNDTKTVLVGAGYINSKMAFEAFIESTPSKRKGRLESDEVLNLVAQGTINLGKRFQLSPSILVETYENENSKTESQSFILAVESEFMINKEFYVGALISLNSFEFTDELDPTEDTENDSTIIGLSGRYRVNNLQVLINYSYGEYDFSESLADIDRTTIGITGTYFF